MDIQSAGGFVGIYDSQLQQVQLSDETSSIYVGNSELRDVTIQSYDLGVSHARLQGKVNIEAKGEITQIPSQGGLRNYPEERALANPYIRDEQPSNQVTITSRSGSIVIVEEE